MRTLLLLAALCVPAAALDWHDEGREPIHVGGGLASYNAATRDASGNIGAVFSAGALLPIAAAWGPPGIDVDWRSADGTKGRVDHGDVMLALRHTIDRTGVFLGAGAGLGWGRYRPSGTTAPFEAASGFGPCAKGVAGYAQGPLYCEAAYIFPAPIDGVRLDGFALTVGLRFGSGWYRP